MPPLKSANYIRRWAESVDTSRNPAPGAATFPLATCLTALETVGIRTDYDLLLQPDILAQTPVALHHHIKALRMVVLAHLSCPGHTAADLIERSEQAAEQPGSIKSGIVGLDQLLNGGLPLRQITELCSKDARITTQVAIEFAAAHLLPEPAANSTQTTKVYYLRSGFLSLWKIDQVVAKRLSLFPAEQRESLHRQALERLIVVDCGDADALLTFLHKYADARAAISEGQQASLATRDLVIIDSIRPLIVTVLQMQNDIDIEVHSVKMALRNITSARLLVNTTVLITNGVSQRENSRTQPSLGAAWGMVSHTHLYLDHESSDADRQQTANTRPSDVGASSGTGRLSKILAVVLKSPRICANSQAVFEIEI